MARQPSEVLKILHRLPATCVWPASTKEFTATLHNESTPPTLSHHEGYLLQAALCISRLPLNYVEPSYEQSWRIFYENWILKTQNHLHLAGSLLSSNTLSLPDATTKSESSNTEIALSGPASIGTSELDALLTAETEQFTVLSKRGKRSTKAEKPFVNKTTHSAVPTQKDDGFHSLTRKPTECLYLTVKYREEWQFPRNNRRHGESMREVLRRLCAEQLGENYTPYFTGYSPFSCEKCKAKHSDIISMKKKVFYYRAHHVPGGSEINIPKNSTIRDYAWMTGTELRQYLSPQKWNAVRYGLYYTD